MNPRTDSQYIIRTSDVGGLTEALRSRDRYVYLTTRDACVARMRELAIIGNKGI